MKHGDLKKAPNYTTAALVMGVVNLFWMLCVILALAGWPMVIATGFVLDRVICHFARR